MKKYYSAFDAFILPSLYEGFGRVIIEALVSNLKVIVSTNIPFNKAFDCDYVPLNKTLWVKKIMDSVSQNKRFTRENFLEEHGYDSGSNLTIMTNIYNDC